MSYEAQRNSANNGHVIPLTRGEYYTLRVADWLIVRGVHLRLFALRHHRRRGGGQFTEHWSTSRLKSLKVLQRATQRVVDTEIQSQ